VDPWLTHAATTVLVAVSAPVDGLDMSLSTRSSKGLRNQQASQLEPMGISRSDGKRPDGVTLIPWSHGKCLCWDVTVVCTMAASHIAGSLSQAGSASGVAERKKVQKYQALSPNFLFKPVGFETLGPWGPEAKTFIKTIGNKIAESTGEPRAVAFLTQRISLELQRGNAASVLGTFVQRDNIDSLFSFPRRRDL
jgi:hypothetical protein